MGKTTLITLAILAAVVIQGCSFGPDSSLGLAVDDLADPSAATMLDMAVDLADSLDPGLPVGLVAPLAEGMPPVVLKPGDPRRVRKTISALQNRRTDRGRVPILVDALLDMGIQDAVLVVSSPLTYGDVAPAVRKLQESSMRLHTVGPASPGVDALAEVSGGHQADPNASGGPGVAVVEVMARATGRRVDTAHLNPARSHTLGALGALQHEALVVISQEAVTPDFVDPEARPIAPAAQWNAEGHTVHLIHHEGPVYMLTPYPTAATVVSISGFEDSGRSPIPVASEAIMVVAGLAVLMTAAWFAVRRFIRSRQSRVLMGYAIHGGSRYPMYSPSYIIGNLSAASLKIPRDGSEHAAEVVLERSGGSTRLMVWHLTGEVHLNDNLLDNGSARSIRHQDHLRVGNDEVDIEILPNITGRR